MDFGLGILTFGTLGFVAVFAYISARETEKLRQAGGNKKSTLSRDGAAERLAELRRGDAGQTEAARSA
jgi:hypothetical protein